MNELDDLTTVRNIKNDIVNKLGEVVEILKAHKDILRANQQKGKDDPDRIVYDAETIIDLKGNVGVHCYLYLEHKPINPEEINNK